MKLKRTRQCKLCPWRVDVDPLDIPNSYSEDKHKALGETTIASLDNPLAATHVMACHETGDAHCVGWLMNQLGPGNNIGLRMSMRNCANLKDVVLIGKQHETFEDTLPG